LNSEAFKQ
jgi:recombination protein RecT